MFFFGFLPKIRSNSLLLRKPT